MRAREGFSLIELLITMAILGALVGVAAPFYQGHLDEVRETKLRAQFKTLKKLLVRAAHEDGLLQPEIPDAHFSPVKARWPTNYPTLERLVPRFLGELPVDPWGNDIYAMGNYLVSNGPTGAPDSRTVIAERIFDYDDIENPDSGEVWVPGEFREAYEQTMWLAKRYADHAASNPDPSSADELYAALGKAMPLDPWGNPYRIEVGGKKYAASDGPDGVRGTDDDADTGIQFPRSTDPNQFDEWEEFSVWRKLHPPEPGRSIRARWDKGGDRLELSNQGGPMLSDRSYWVHLQDIRLNDGDGFGITTNLDFELSSGAPRIGIFGNYRGRGTGYTATLNLGSDPSIRLGTGVPTPRGWPHGAAPPPASAGSITPTAGSITLELVLDVSGSTATVRARVTGAVSSGWTSAAFPAAARTPNGACGFYVIAPGKGDRFTTRWRDFEVWRP